MHNESQNIVMVVFAEYPTDVRVRREAEALQSEGYSVEVICIGPKKSQKRDTHNGVHIHRIVMKKNRNNKLAYFFQYGFFIFRAFLKLSFLHLRKKYKIVHIHNLPDVLVFCAILPKLSGAKILLDMHEIMPEFFMRKYNISESQFIIWLLKKMEKLSASFADHVIVATPFLYDIITERATRKEKCTTVLNLPDLKYLNNNKVNGDKENGAFRIIYPGTLGHIQGVDLAINAVKLVAEQIDNIELHLYGNGPEEAYLSSLIKRLGVEEKVLYHGSYHYEELFEVLGRMDVGLVPKRDGIFIGEAMSTKLFEYAAAGIPAIVSHTKGDSLFFDDSMVMFFTPGDEADLAEKIKLLYESPRLRKDLANNARLVMQRINWQVERKKLLSSYSDLAVAA